MYLQEEESEEEVDESSMSTVDEHS